MLEEEKRIQEETDPLTVCLVFFFPIHSTCFKHIEQDLHFCIFTTRTDTLLPLILTFPPAAGSQDAPLCAGSMETLWSSHPTFPLSQMLQPAWFLCQPGATEAHEHHFGLVSPLGVTFKSDFLSSLSVWMTRYSVRRLEGEEVIKRNSANLSSFLSLPDNLFICSHLTRCRQTYFPMERANPSPKVPMCTWTSLPSTFNSHCKVPLIFWGKQKQLQHTQM